jgi:hypothetical protein
MPHISKKKLPRALEKAVLSQLFSFSSDGRLKRNALSDLLTETERLMLAKRLAAVVLFLEDASIYRVRRVLSISPSTAVRLRQYLDGGEYRAIEKLFRTRKQREQFWENLERLLRGGLPEMGKGRWKRLDELYGKRDYK